MADPDNIGRGTRVIVVGTVGAGMVAALTSVNYLHVESMTDLEGVELHRGLTIVSHDHSITTTDPRLTLTHNYSEVARDSYYYDAHFNDRRDSKEANKMLSRRLDSQKATKIKVRAHAHVIKQPRTLSPTKRLRNKR